MRRLPLLLLPLVLLAACTASETRVSELLPVADRERAPDVVAGTVDGGTLALADLDGPVVVNFWASWCGPCVREAPELRNLALAYGERGVRFVGVNVNDSATNARRFERDLDIPYPSWVDASVEISASFGGIGPSAMPTTILLDAEHRVAVRLIGAVTYTQVRSYLDPLLEEAGR
jgi:thiol-disulfide isomerase/thioredoxin